MAKEILTVGYDEVEKNFFRRNKTPVFSRMMKLRKY